MNDARRSFVPAVALLLTAGALLGGCASSQHEGAYTPVSNNAAAIENSERVVLMDSMVQQSVDCSGISERRLPNGRLEVSANIRNRETRRIQVQIQCVFKNADGFSSGDETPWRNLILTENSQETVSFASMNDKAETYTIRVRQAH